MNSFMIFVAPLLMVAGALTLLFWLGAKGIFDVKDK
ncbi:cytochrome bd oxidase small subunit CydS [Longirhabdus pacifica]